MHKIQRRLFTQEENFMISQSVRLIGEDWDVISRFLPGRTPKQIHDRYVNYLRDGLKKDAWTKEEDDILLTTMKEIGPKWSKMTSQLPGRSANDIKNRWHKHLLRKNLNLGEENANQSSGSAMSTKNEKLNDDGNDAKYFDDLFDLCNSTIMSHDDGFPDFIDDVCLDNWDVSFF